MELGASIFFTDYSITPAELAARMAARLGPDSGRPARRRSTAFRDGWTAWRRRASRNPAAPRNAVSPWEAGAPRSTASRWEAAANPWLGAIARCSRTGSSNPSPSSKESCKPSVPRLCWALQRPKTAKLRKTHAEVWQPTPVEG